MNSLKNNMLRVVLSIIIVLFSLTALGYNMNNSPVTTCSGSFYDSGGSGSDYGSGETFTKIFTPATAGSMLQFDFTSFETEGGYDELLIYNGPTTGSPLIGTYDGTNSPGIVTASNPTGQLTFVFTSDGSVQDPGWAATISCVNPVLMTNGSSTGCSGIFTDPQGFSNYTDFNGSMTYTFCSGTAEAIQFEFTSFETREAADNLSIYDGSNTASPLIGSYSSTTSPGTITSSGTCLTFVWTTDNNQADRIGWTASFSCVPAPPSNDDCTDAISVPVNPDDNCGSITSGTINNATQSPQPNNCSGTPNDDVWYSFTATSPVHFIDLLNVSGSTSDLYHSVYEDNCGSIGTALLCSDPNSSTITGLTPGNTYFIRIYSWSSSTGANTGFDLCVGTPPPPPANDECSGAISVPVNADDNCGTVTAGTIEGALPSSQNDNCGGTPNDDVWYSFTATSTANYIDLLNVSGSSTDLYHSVYEDNCGSIGTALLCSDPNSSTVTGLTPGNTYLIRIYSWNDDIENTEFNLCVGTPPPPPPNDECSGAIDVLINDLGSCVNIVSGTVEDATESNQTNDCFGTANNDVWYSFTAEETSQEISLNNISGSTTDMYFSVYEGICGSPGAALLCSDDNTNIVGGLTVGNQYFVRVYTWSSTDGANSTFDLCISDTPPEPDNKTCPTMEPICSGSTIAFTASSGGADAAAGNDYDCLNSQPNPTWFYMEIDGSGDLSIDITGDSDVDYALWGPFNDLVDAQNNCDSYGTPKDCSFSPSETEQANIASVTAGEVYVLLVTNYADVVQSIYVSESTSNTASTDCEVVTLPVDLISFEANLVDEKVDLYWSTASERECDYFEIQRSADGQVWETIGFKEGSGTTQQLSTYYYTDKKPMSGISYYRLKQHDFNGDFEMLPIKSVDNKGEDRMIDVFPNPSSELVNVKSVHNKIKNIEVSGANGKVVFQKNEVNEYVSKFNCKGFSPGVYFIEIVTIDNNRYIEKLIVK